MKDDFKATITVLLGNKQRTVWLKKTTELPFVPNAGSGLIFGPQKEEIVLVVDVDYCVDAQELDINATVPDELETRKGGKLHRVTTNEWLERLGAVGFVPDREIVMKSKPNRQRRAKRTYIR